MIVPSPIKKTITVSPFRKVKETDVVFLQSIIETTGLFPSGLLEEMMEDYLTKEDSQDIWLTQELGGRPVILAYLAPEKLTNGTYNLYLIAVHREFYNEGEDKIIFWKKLSREATC